MSHLISFLLISFSQWSLSPSLRGRKKRAKFMLSEVRGMSRLEVSRVLGLGATLEVSWSRGYGEVALWADSGSCGVGNTMWISCQHWTIRIFSRKSYIFWLLFKKLVALAALVGSLTKMFMWPWGAAIPSLRGRVFWFTSGCAPPDAALA